MLAAVRAFHAVRPLCVPEVEALWPLVVIRGAVLVASGHHQAGVDEANAYAPAGFYREQLIFDRATRSPTGDDPHRQGRGLHGRTAARADAPAHGLLRGVTRRRRPLSRPVNRRGLHG